MLPHACQKLAYRLLRPAHTCKGKAIFFRDFFAVADFLFFLGPGSVAFGSWLVWLLWLLWLLRLLSFSFTILHLFPHAICNILGPQPVSLHASCNILGPQPVILHALCSILGPQPVSVHASCNNLSFCMLFAAFGDLNLSF